MVKAVLPAMKAQGDGRIVNILTQGVEWVLPTFGAYTGSKAALAHLTKLMALELGQYGIRVNGVCPGPIWAPALQGYLQQLADERGVELQVVYDEWAAETALEVPRTAGGHHRHRGVPRVGSRQARDRSGDLHRCRPVVPLRTGVTQRTPDPAFRSSPDRAGIPLADPTRHGTGVYRRRIRLESTAPGVVVGRARGRLPPLPLHDRARRHAS